jgi:uncharacterized protein with WD repeat
VAFSPDGSALAAPSNAIVTLWDASTGQELHALHGTWIASVAFSPNGTRLASASDDGQAKLWDTATGQLLQTLKGHAMAVWSVAFSPDGKRLVTGSQDGSVKLWDVATGQELRTLLTDIPGVRSVAFSPDGNLVVAAGEGGKVILLDARPRGSAEVEATLLMHTQFGKPLARSAVREAVQKQLILSDAVRQKALQLVDRFPEETDPEKYYAAAWPVLRHPYANVLVTKTALAQMQTACATAPAEDKYRSVLGIAHYRLGKFHKEQYLEALALLTKCHPDQPATLAFLAMTQHRLGHQVEAQANLARLRKILQTPDWANDQQSQGLLVEAQTVIHP